MARDLARELVPVPREDAFKVPGVTWALLAARGPRQPLARPGMSPSLLPKGRGREEQGTRLSWLRWRR